MNGMTKRPKPTKRRRTKAARFVHLDRVYPARLIRVKPDPDKRYVVEVHITRTRRKMRDQTRRWHNDQGPDTRGAVLSNYKSRSGRPVLREGRVVAFMFLNQRDLRDAPGLLVSHESAHAGMAWARFRRADLRKMPGEEVMAHATGELTQQITNRLWGMGVLG